MKHHVHHSLIVRFANLVFAIIAPMGAHQMALAQLAHHPALDPTTTSNMQKILLGDWGESATTELLKVRGYEVIDPTVGPHGLDRIAIKRDASGNILETCFIEVKTRTAAGDLGLPGMSKNGPQLTQEKIIADLTNTVTNHRDPKVRSLVKTTLERYQADPTSVRVERHVITVEDGRYTIYDGPTTTRPAGRPLANGSLDNVFERLGKSSNPEVAASARLNRAYLQTQQASLTKARPVTLTARGAPTVTRTAAADMAATGDGKLMQFAFKNGVIMTRPLTAVANAAVAGFATSAVVAGIAGYDWYQGSISDERLHEELIRAGGDGVAVFLATGAVLLLTPAAPGIVIIAVGAGVAIMADVAFDWAMERENEHLIANEYIIRYGFNPSTSDDIRWMKQPPLRNPLADELNR